jgi:hypothetical protein
VVCWDSPLEKLNAGYAALRRAPHAWAEHFAERQLWDATLMDGLDVDSLTSVS